MNEIRAITEDELVSASEVLSRAFFADPLQNYTFPDADERAAKSPMHFLAALKYGYKFGDV